MSSLPVCPHSPRVPQAKDFMTAKNNPAGKAFTSLVYSADGRCVLAGGESKFVCIYEVRHALLVKKFQLSHNRSIDGVLDMLNSKNMTDAGPANLIDNSDDDSDEDRAREVRLHTLRLKIDCISAR